MSEPNTTAAVEAKGKRQKPVPEGSREALRVAACVLEVLAGMRGPSEAATALGVSLVRYYQLEQRALAGLVRGCEPLRRGRSGSPGGELERLRRDNERLARECHRQQALVRLARQAAELSAPPEQLEPKKKRPRCRGKDAARRMQQASEEAAQPG
jgi:hypothetical protein